MVRGNLPYRKQRTEFDTAERREDRITPPIPATFSMTMLGLTPAGDAYTMKQYERMLSEA